MKRINIYSENDYDRTFEGWFDIESATEIASYSSGSPYVTGKILFATAKGRLVVNSWNNTGYDNYRFSFDEAEISEILVRGGHKGDDKKLADILAKYEI